MPKLDAKKAKAVEESEAMGGGFLLPDGRYAARLKKVTEVPPSGDKVYPYWDWEFDALHNEAGEKQAGRQWNRTSLSPKSAGFLKATFEAFGYTSDSDTDEMLGDWVVLYLSQETQTQGKNVGKLRNNVDRLAPFDPDEWEFDPEAVPESRDEPSGDGGGGAAGDDF